MATVEIYIKHAFHWTVIETDDIIAARTKNLAHVIIDSPEATVRLRFTEDEAISLATKITVPPNL